MLGASSKQSSQVKMFQSHVNIFYGKMPSTRLCEIYQNLGYEIILYVWFGAQNEPTPTNTPCRMDENDTRIQFWVGSLLVIKLWQSPSIIFLLPTNLSKR